MGGVFFPAELWCSSNDGMNITVVLRKSWAWPSEGAVWKSRKGNPAAEDALLVYNIRHYIHGLYLCLHLISVELLICFF